MHLRRGPSCQQDLGPAGQVSEQQEQHSLALMGNKPLRISAEEKALCLWVHTNTNTSRILPPGFLHQERTPLAEELWRLLPAHSSPGTSEFEPAYGFNDETAAGLLGRASPAAQQLSLGVTRTVSSENPWDLVLIVTTMAPSVGFFFRQHLHSPVSLITYRSVAVLTDPWLTCSLEVSEGVLALAGSRA